MTATSTPGGIELPPEMQMALDEQRAALQAARHPEPGMLVRGVVDGVEGPVYEIVERPPGADGIYYRPSMAMGLGVVELISLEVWQYLCDRDSVRVVGRRG